MGSRNRQRHNGPRISWSNSNGMNPGDNIGNRRSFKEIRIPADDIGNRTESKRRADLLRDDIGNSIDVAPTHSLSGVMIGPDGKQRRNRETAANTMRVGKYIVGGVNPIVAGGNHFAPSEENLEIDSKSSSDFFEQDNQRSSKNKKRRKKRRNESNRSERAETFSSADSAEKRLKRLFDFDEDDRFEYVLSSDPEQKRLAAQNTVQTILAKSSCIADIEARLLKRENRQSVLVIFEEKELGNSQKPVYVRGSVELTALNFLVNKIVNRYPNDRIRLAVLPKVDEEEYIKSFNALELVENKSSFAPVEETL